MLAYLGAPIWFATMGLCNIVQSVVGEHSCATGSRCGRPSLRPKLMWEPVAKATSPDVTFDNPR